MPLDTYPKVIPGAPRPSAVRLPQGLTLPAGVERYHVEGGGAILVQLHQGDRVSIRNMEGGQAAELLAICANGQCDIGALGAPANAQAEGVRAVLSSGDTSLHRVRRKLEQLGAGLAHAPSLRLFDAATKAGASEEFTATRDAHLLIAAPGDAMSPHGQDTLTPLAVLLTRAKLRPRAGFDLPDPLADPLADIRVRSATAEAYFVKAGDFIQILDVDGRQCTDFQCFDARKLDRGLQRPLDVTTTRTLMGHAYPMPGLHAKYYDQDMDPLVEVVQDTCGRHDAFAMACAAKYYDDIGYPGHVNCTDNFNGALAGFGADPRPGWMAINFFFNTGLDDHGVLYTDEPWSRPGDYVLLRALTDLVCVSSACPDDTTAANGWNPTDIHVRTYSGTEPFKRAIAIRATPDSEPKMTKETGFHASFAKFTGNFVEYNGYWLASSFATAGTIQEYWACRQKSVIMDLSPLRKFEITGPDAEALCQYIFTRNVKTMAEGAVVYTAMCYPHGGMIDDGTLFRLGRDKFPLDRWHRLRRRVDSRTGRKSGAERAWCGPRPTSCTMSPCKGRKAVTCCARWSGLRHTARPLTSWTGSASRPRGCTGPMVCPSLCRARANTGEIRLRGDVPPARLRRRVRCDLGRRARPRADPFRAGCAGHGADRSRTDLCRL